MKQILIVMIAMIVGLIIYLFVNPIVLEMTKYDLETGKYTYYNITKLGNVIEVRDFEMDNHETYTFLNCQYGNSSCELYTMGENEVVAIEESDKIVKLISGDSKYDFCIIRNLYIINNRMYVAINLTGNNMKDSQLILEYNKSTNNLEKIVSTRDLGDFSYLNPISREK